MTTNFHALGRRGRIKIMNFWDLRQCVDTGESGRGRGHMENTKH